MAICTSMSGKEINQSLKAFYDAMAAAAEAENDGLVLYIRDGAVAFEAEDALFDIVELTETEEEN